MPNIIKQSIPYQLNGLTFDGFVAYPETPEKKPGILIFPDWSGKSTLTCEKAEKLAELGYVGFAVDMYGGGKCGNNREECAALMTPLMQDRALLRTRLLAALQTVTALTAVDPEKIGAIGFCFGGLCALDLARSGAAVRGVVSFHGNFTPLPTPINHPMHTRILALHGYDDPLTPMSAVNDFMQEMENAKADWEINIYGHTTHSFTNPNANDPAFGTVYSKKADERSWIAMKAFFTGMFGKK